MLFFISHEMSILRDSDASGIEVTRTVDSIETDAIAGIVGPCESRLDARATEEQWKEEGVRVKDIDSWER